METSYQSAGKLKMANHCWKR